MRNAARLIARHPGSQARAWLVLGILTLAVGILASRPATAQDSAAPQLQSASELADLVGPIALYPDDLIGVVLPASTYPLQIVQAARFLDERATDSTLKASDNWDDSVVALLNYPEVVRLLNDDLDWTWELGAAVLNQRPDVLDAIQVFRDRAYAAGNLRSDDRQVVSNNGSAIAIAPANPEVIYVPYYEPRRVLVYQSTPVFHYYPWAYPVYYYPYPAGYAFRTGFFWGVTSVFSIGWHTHHLHVYDYGYRDHPYYGRNYYAPFYARNSININVNVNRGSNVWEPRRQHPARPFARSEGYRVDARRPDGGSRSVPGSANSYRNGAAAANGAAVTRQRDPAGSAYRAGGGTPRDSQPDRARIYNDRENQAAPSARPTQPPARAQAPGQQRSTTTQRPTFGGVARAPEPNRARIYNDRENQAAPSARPTQPPARAQAPGQRSTTTQSPSFSSGIARAPESNRARIYNDRQSQAAPSARPTQPPARTQAPGQQRSTTTQAPTFGGIARPTPRSDGGGGGGGYRSDTGRGGSQHQPQRGNSNNARHSSR